MAYFTNEGYNFYSKEFNEVQESDICLFTRIGLYFQHVEM
jgi:hypothetical protein